MLGVSFPGWSLDLVDCAPGLQSRELLGTEGAGPRPQESLAPLWSEPGHRKVGQRVVVRTLHWQEFQGSPSAPVSRRADSSSSCVQNRREDRPTSPRGTARLLDPAGRRRGMAFRENTFCFYPFQN